MMPLKLEMLDVLGGVVASNVPATSLNAPDFAKLVAVAGQGALAPELSVQASTAVMPIPRADDPAAAPSNLAPSRNGDLTQRVSTSLDTNDAGASDIMRVAPKAGAAAPELTVVEPESVQSNNAPTVAAKRQTLHFKANAPEPTEGQPTVPHDHPSEVVPTPEAKDRQSDQVTPKTTNWSSEAQIPEILVAASAVPAIPPAISQIEDKAQPPAIELVPQTPMCSRAAKADMPQDKSAPKTNEPIVSHVAASAAPLMPEAPRLLMPQAEPVAPPSVENRTPSAVPTLAIERALPSLVERMVAFTPTIIDAARDLAQLGDARDMKFNVRPETLGPVAVTIERTDVGQNLRLGVESPAAVQVVRQAESALNDLRNGNPFVNVTVDMTASDQRGRAPRAAPALRQGHPTIPNEDRNAPALAGRYA